MKVVSVQNEYNLGNRESERVLERCEKLGIAFLPGTRSAPARSSAPGEKRSEEAAGDAGPGRDRLAARQVARDAADPGTASIAHLEENMRAAGLRLGPDDVRALS